jgi:pyruvate,orthophosphate dikinase
MSRRRAVDWSTVRATVLAVVAGDALRAAVHDVASGRCDRAAALLRLTPADLEEVLHGSFAGTEGRVIATGLCASPGAATGQVCFSAEAAADAVERGGQVLLVKAETSPEDVFGMQVAQGILTTRGGLASHAAVVARGWGIPAVVGCDEVTLASDHLVASGVRVLAGDVLSIDGSTGEVMLGAAEVSSAGPPPELDQVLGWADEIRDGRLGVLANADTAEDAIAARRFGADGVGLCRTEHLFLGEGRLAVLRRAILAESPAEEAAALAALGEAQRIDLFAVLEAMDGLPIAVRLLDPPLHEFLPDLLTLSVREATGQLTAEERSLLDAARSWAEHNPMLGVRGVRLGLLRPGIYRMQLSALVHAVADRLRAGGDPRAEVLVPLTVGGAELAAVGVMLEAALVEAGNDGRAVRSRLSLASMIETPRAALLAAELAQHVEAFSIGTNDLTQLTYGLSRDDVSARLLPAYVSQGLLPDDPFATLDPLGVGELVRTAVTRGRAAHAGLRVTVCGEHGGHPASIRTLFACGVDAVSCSPYRIPVARLAAAQAILEHDLDAPLQA